MMVDQDDGVDEMAPLSSANSNASSMLVEPTPMSVVTTTDHEHLETNSMEACDTFPSSQEEPFQQQQQQQQQQLQMTTTAITHSTTTTTDNNFSSTEQELKDDIVKEIEEEKDERPLRECQLKDETVYKLMDRSVGSITLECGYHSTHKACLEILSDVCCDYIKRISSMLRLAVDTEDWRDSESDFVDSLERVFHQINIPSAVNLHQFVCRLSAIKMERHKHQVTTAAARRTPTTNAMPNSNSSALCNENKSLSHV